MWRTWMPILRKIYFPPGRFVITRGDMIGASGPFVWECQLGHSWVYGESIVVLGAFACPSLPHFTDYRPPPTEKGIDIGQQGCGGRQSLGIIVRDEKTRPD